MAKLNATRQPKTMRFTGQIEMRFAGQNHATTQTVITAFIRIYGEHVEEEYAGFRLDSLETFGRAIMKREFWTSDLGERASACSKKSIAPGRNSFTASLFFCLLYLPTSCVQAWTQSLLAIDSPFFRTDFIIWLAGTYESMKSEQFSLGSLPANRFCIRWTGDFLLRNTTAIIPRMSRTEFLKVIRSQLSMEILMRWLDEIAQFDDLDTEVRALSVADYMVDVILTDTDRILGS
jgi:hypothetical protein